MCIFRVAAHTSHHERSLCVISFYTLLCSLLEKKEHPPRKNSSRRGINKIKKEFGAEGEPREEEESCVRRSNILEFPYLCFFIVSSSFGCSVIKGELNSVYVKLRSVKKNRFSTTRITKLLFFGCLEAKQNKQRRLPRRKGQRGKEGRIIDYKTTSRSIHYLAGIANRNSRT